LCPTVQQVDGRVSVGDQRRMTRAHQAQNGIRAGLACERRDTPDRGDR